MFKDFSSFNQVQDKILQPKSVFALRDAISTQSSVLSELGTLVGRYTRAYNSVQVIKYDENGDPIDVTPSEQLTVPQNTLDYMKARIDQIRAQLDEYRDIVADLTASLTVTPQQWIDDPQGSYKYNLGGHLVSPSQLGSNIPILTLFPDRAVSYGSTSGVEEFRISRSYTDENPGDSTALFAATFPDTVVKVGSSVAGLAWNANDMFLLTTDQSNYKIYFAGTIYEYSNDGSYITSTEIGDLDFNGFCQTYGTAVNAVFTLPTFYVKASTGATGPKYNAVTTENPKVRINDYQSDVQAIAVDNIILPDQNLVDLKSTL